MSAGVHGATPPAEPQVGPRSWSDSTLCRVGTVLSVLSILAAPTTLILVALAGELDRAVGNYTVVIVETALVYGVLGLLLVRAATRNRLVWFFVFVGLSNATIGIITGIVELMARDQGVPFEQIDTSGWPAGVATVVGGCYALWVFGNFGLPTFGLLLAPDGRLPSRRWLPVAIAAAASLLVFWLAFADNWPVRGGDPDLLADATARGVVTTNYLLLIVLLIPLSYGSLVVRYRRSDGAARRRLRWVLIGGGLFVVAFFAEVSGTEIFLIVFYPLLALAFGMAIWRDQLYDIDVVINRALVYGSILTAIGLIYVAVVFGIGSTVGQRMADSAVLPLAATGLVAMVVQPLRSRLDRWASRLVFGRRATPYEVLSDFTQGVAATDEQLLADVARSVVDGTTATGATVWTVADGALSSLSSWPPDRQLITTTTLPGAGGSDEHGQLAVPGADRTYPIRHEGHLIGALGLSLPLGETLPPADRSLVAELSAGIGLALHNRELTGELRTRIDQLQASRRRLVAVQDATRHRLERDLHDGAQQRLVAAKVRLSIAQQMAEKAGARGVADHLGTLCRQADEAIESLRDTARRAYPPVLESEGLAAALRPQLERSSLAVDLSGELSSRHGRDIEATAYFAVLEAIAAIERTGAGAPVTVVVTDDDGGATLRFEVSTPAPVDPLAAVEDRVDALGGTIDFGPTPTVLRAEIPTAGAGAGSPPSAAPVVLPV